MMMDESKVVETVSEGYEIRKQTPLKENPAAKKGDPTRNPEHTKQTA